VELGVEGVARFGQEGVQQDAELLGALDEGVIGGDGAGHEGESLVT
jgi:hypothetical protein